MFSNRTKKNISTVTYALLMMGLTNDQIKTGHAPLPKETNKEKRDPLPAIKNRQTEWFNPRPAQKKAKAHDASHSYKRLGR